MHLRLTLFLTTSLTLLLATTGCRKVNQADAPIKLPPTQLASDCVLRLHWMGKHRLAVAASAYNFMRVWNLPESGRLEAQSLDKLAAYFCGGAAAKKDAQTAVRSLLDDALQSEGFLEIWRGSNETMQVVYALPQDDPQARVWHFNLAGVVSALTGAQPTMKAASWSARDPHSSRQIALARAGRWTVIGINSGNSTLWNETLVRIQRDGVPYVPRTEGSWVEVDLDANWAAHALGWKTLLTAGQPHITLAINGDGAHVLTTAQIHFATPQNLPLNPWHIPTNEIHDPLVSFTAGRGLDSWLAASEAGKRLTARPLPDQFYLWGPEGIPAQMALALRRPNAAAFAGSLLSELEQRANPWLADHHAGNISTTPTETGGIWNGLPLLTPFLTLPPGSGDDLLVGGTMTNAYQGTNTHSLVYPQPTLAELLSDISGRTNLIYFDWEQTGPRVESCLYLLQVLRVTFHTPQLPPDSAGMRWLGTVSPRLGNSTTTLTQAGPQDLVFTRRSSLGLTAFELHLVVDWLEAKDFPRTLRSLESP